MEVRTVLCPVDFTGQTGRELAWAKQICQLFDSRLVVEHNLDPRPPNFLTVTWMWSEEFEGEEEHKAGKAQERLRGLLEELSQDVACEAKLTRGPIDEVLLLLTRELPADLLVMGSHGWSSPEHQSLTEKMIAKCQVPVFTVGNAEEDVPQLFAGDERAEAVRILVSVDNDRKMQSAVTYAARLASRIGGELLLLEVLAPDVSKGGDERLVRAGERLRDLLGDDSPGGNMRSEAVAGEEVASILEQAQEGRVDLIVRQIHSGMMPWNKQGRQADFDLLHRSPCPVIYVPARYEV